MNIDLIAKIMGFLGVPSVMALAVPVVGLVKKIRILMEAQQAQMCRDLLMDYKQYMNQGWISDDDLIIWEKNYQKYHSLGANGVMDAKRAKLLELPNIPQ